MTDHLTPEEAKADYWASWALAVRIMRDRISSRNRDESKSVPVPLSEGVPSLEHSHVALKTDDLVSSSLSSVTCTAGAANEPASAVFSDGITSDWANAQNDGASHTPDVMGAPAASHRSGCRPSDRAAFGVSPLRASIPSATVRA